jgi:hypothetical protein
MIRLWRDAVGPVLGGMWRHENGRAVLSRVLLALPERLGGNRADVWTCPPLRNHNHRRVTGRIHGARRASRRWLLSQRRPAITEHYQRSSQRVRQPITPDFHRFTPRLGKIAHQLVLPPVLSLRDTKSLALNGDCRNEESSRSDFSVYRHPQLTGRARKQHAKTEVGAHITKRRGGAAFRPRACRFRPRAAPLRVQTAPAARASRSPRRGTIPCRCR